MNTKNKIIEPLKVLLILISGWITFFMMLIIPIGGGGISLVFVVTVPLFVGVSVLISILYLVFRRKMSGLMQFIYVITSIFLLTTFALTMYPYAN